MQELVARNKANRKKLRKEYMKTIKEYWQAQKDFETFVKCKTVLTSEEEKTFNNLPYKVEELRNRLKELFRGMNYTEGGFSYWYLEKRLEKKPIEIVSDMSVIIMTVMLIVLLVASAFYFILFLLNVL